MADKEVNITYDTLFEILRREKNREELQQLQETFFDDVVAYLREKNSILKKTEEDNIFAGDEREKTRQQLDNVKKILKELYEKRERKIMEMSMFKSRTNSGLINTANLLKEEKLIFESLVEDLNRFRAGVLVNILSANEPSIAQTKSAVAEQIPAKESSHTEEKKDAQENTNYITANIAVRFISHVPKFVGKELEAYGPFEPEDTANLPKQIAEILVRKGRAEVVEIK